MLKITVNLPTKRRLDLSLVKRRKSPQDKPLFPDLNLIKRSRKGNKVSRIFRHIFEHKKIKRLLGTNLVFFLIASSILPGESIKLDNPEENVVVQASLTLTTEKKIQYPIENPVLSQGYGLFHSGLDFDSVTGEPVLPVMAGEVEDLSYSNLGYGNAVLVNHGEGLTSLYAHLSKIKVFQGEEVTTKTVLGEIGSSGTSSGDHLHLEVREQGYPINPFSVLPAR